AELNFIEQLVHYRLNNFLNSELALKEPFFPEPDQWSFPIKKFASQHQLSKEEIIILWIALAAHIKGDLFDVAVQKQLTTSGDFPGLGGARGKNFRGFLPTGETAVFLLAENDLMKRFEVQQVFSPDHLFAKNNIVRLEEVPPGEPAMSGKIILSQEYVELFTTGNATRPHFNSSFPARLIQTELEWNDLVLGEEVMQHIKELEQWLRYNKILVQDWGMGNRLKKGYRVLFHGPPGTGKTLTASLLGKYTGREVYKIDLSMVVSKYIGETEKNLENLFAKAETKNWILFFDEADALFGKRTGVRDAHDKYANQEVSYLLQRVEDFDGLVILASNMKNNIDDAFIRRFNAIIRFPLPDENDRAIIWEKSFPSKIGFKNNMNVPQLVKRYELTGGNIINVVHYACLRAVEKKDTVISLEDVVQGIKREMHKEGKQFANIL
ncbi:MAG: ATP-binding protein, partial [Chitinophagaceae bacterium]